MPTPNQRRYSQAVDQIVKGYLQRENETIRQTVAVLMALRDRIAGELSAGDNFALNQLRRNLDNLIADMQGQLSGIVSSSATAAYISGQQSVIAPLVAIGYNVAARPSQAQAVTLANFSADLIQGISAETLAKINTQLRLAGLGGITNVEAMREISKLLGFSGRRKIAGGIAARAETVIRTEMQRAFNISAYSQGLESAELIPDLLKRWMHSGKRNGRPAHLRVHLETAEKPIPYKQPFVVGGESMRYPLDPAASAKNTVHCGCKVQAIVPEVGVLSSSLDERIRQQLEHVTA